MCSCERKMKGEKAARYCLIKNRQLCTQLEMAWGIFHHANNNIGGASKICKICNLERIAILAEVSKQLLNKTRGISNSC